MLEYIGIRISMALAGAESLRDNLRRDEGQTLTEYALILSLIAVGVTGALIFLGDEIRGLFSTIASQI